MPAGPPPITATSHQAVRLVEIAVMRLLVHAAEAGAAADDRLPEFPGALRPEEGLVVEADGQEFCEMRRSARRDRWSRLPSKSSGPRRAGPSVIGKAIGEHVRLVGKLHQRVGVLPGHGEHAARSAIFEGAGENPAVVRRERARDRVAGKAGKDLAVEGERHRPLPVDPFAGLRGQPVRAALMRRSSGSA